MNCKSPRRTRQHTDYDHVELETTLQKLVLNLLRDCVETDIRVSTDLFNGGGGHG